MIKVALVGGGKIGEMICDFLLACGDYSITLIDSSPKQLDKHCMNVNHAEQCADILNGHFALLSACPYHLTLPLARLAIQARAHYLDLTEDVASTRAVRDLPQCGLAPGFISIVANDIAGRFDALDTISMRVGALPEYPTNSLIYNLTWSTDGVINEYCEPCTAIVNGEVVEVPPLGQREEFSLDGITYESFNTSGGLGTLGDTLQGEVRNLRYQTIRYPGIATS